MVKGISLLMLGALAVGGYLLYTKVLKPSNNGSPPTQQTLDQFGRPPNKLRGPPSGLDPYSGVANDGTPTVYQDDWIFGRL